MISHVLQNKFLSTSLTLNEEEEMTENLNPDLNDAPPFSFLVVIKILYVFNYAVLAFFAYLGFSMYFFIAINIYISPFCGMATSFSIPNYPLFIANLLQLIVGYPFHEIVILIPFGLVLQLTKGKKIISKISPLYMATNLLKWAYNNYYLFKVQSYLALIADFLLFSIFTALIVVYFAISSRAVTFLIFAMISLPVVVGLFKILILFTRCWYYLIFNDVKLTTHKSISWPFLDIWDKFASDPESNNLRKAFNPFGKHSISTIIFILMYLCMIGLNIYECVTNYTSTYVFATILNLFLFPFYMRFNFNKTKNKKFGENNPRLVKWSSIIKGITGILWFFYGYYLYTVGTYSIQQPKPYVFPVNGTEFPPPVKYPSEGYCQMSMSTYSAVQMVGLAGLGYQSDFGNESMDTSLLLIFGEKYKERITIKGIEAGKYLGLVHIYDNETDLDVISIRGSKSISDYGLMYIMNTLYPIPEWIFSMIPFASLLFKKFLYSLVHLFLIPIELYSPDSLIKHYSDPLLRHLLLNVNESRRVLFMGHAVGGAVSKLFGMSTVQPSFALNGPRVSLWYTGDVRTAITDRSRVINLLTKNADYVGREEGDTSFYFPFEKYPESYVPYAELYCLTAAQCGTMIIPPSNESLVNATGFVGYCEHQISMSKIRSIIQ